MRIRLREQHTNVICPNNMEMMLLSKMEGKRRKKEELLINSSIIIGSKIYYLKLEIIKANTKQDKEEKQGRGYKLHQCSLRENRLYLKKTYKHKI